MISGTSEGSNELLDIQQAATFLKVSQTSLRRWTNAGLLACLRVGGRRERRFRRADLLAFMEHHGGSETARADHQVEAATQLVCFHATDAERSRQAVRLLAEALERGTRSYLVSSGTSRRDVLASLTLLRSTLTADLNQGRLRENDYAANVEQQLTFWDHAIKQAIIDGAGSLCFVSDVTEHFPAMELASYEHRFHALIDASEVTVQSLCAYDVQRLSGVDLTLILLQHPDTLSPDARRLNHC